MPRGTGQILKTARTRGKYSQPQKSPHGGVRIEETQAPSALSTASAISPGSVSAVAVTGLDGDRMRIHAPTESRLGPTFTRDYPLRISHSCSMRNCLYAP